MFCGGFQMATAKKMVVPKTLGGIIDRMRELEIEAAVYELKAKVLWEQYSVLEAHLLEAFGAQKLNGATGKLARIEVHNDPIKDAYPAVTDWDQVYTYIVKHKAWELLQKRMGLNAWRERLEQKIIVPGTEVFAKITLKLLTVKKRR